MATSTGTSRARRAPGAQRALACFKATACRGPAPRQTAPGQAAVSLRPAAPVYVSGVGSTLGSSPVEVAVQRSSVRRLMTAIVFLTRCRMRPAWFEALISSAKGHTLSWMVCFKIVTSVAGITAALGLRRAGHGHPSPMRHGQYSSASFRVLSRAVGSEPRRWAPIVRAGESPFRRCLHHLPVVIASWRRTWRDAGADGCPLDRYQYLVASKATAASST